MTNIKVEIDATDYLYNSSDSGISNHSRKRRRTSESDSDFSYEDIKLQKSSRRSDGRTGRGIVIKPVDQATRCLTHANCRRISDEMRVEINRNFEQLEYQEKRDFISSSVVCSVFDNDQTGPYARKHSNEYHLYWTDELGEILDFTVCRAMFINTIGITPWTMRNWLGENLALQNKVVKQEPKKPGRKPTKEVKKQPKVTEKNIKTTEVPYKFKSMLIARYLKEIGIKM